MDDAKDRPRKWKRWLVVLLMAFVLCGWLVLGSSPILRARKVRVGMTRAEVHQIMGASQLRFKEGGVIGGSVRIEAGECWDDGGALKANFDHWRRKLGLLNSFKTRGQYAVEIRFDASDRVEIIEIRDESSDADSAAEGKR
jgi:hypothetical protein